MNPYIKRFITLLESIFEIDKSDLDFGIYRILNVRKKEIENFFKETLPKEITATLAPFAQGNKDEILQQIAKIEAQAQSMGMTIDTLPDNAEAKIKYNEFKSQLAQGTDVSALENDVYSALFQFFNRYYEDGDFISKRRYKEGVYAIPYEGEEVKLYWANQDQYYIKTSENFKDYTFTADEYTIHFRLVDVTTEQNNNKEDDKNKRTFMLFTENEESHPGLKRYEYNTETKELFIRFIYDIPEDKTIKYAEENLKDIRRYLAEDNAELMPVLLRNVSADLKKPLSLIEKHLKGYVAKNSFDYFIHKDLGKFLSRELDFFIKSEVMHLDDLDTENEHRAETFLAKVRAVKRVGKIIIDFLAQLENFQRKLWLKKKFVVETNWCITLDKIDERFYEEIISNKAQIDEWIDMYAIDEAEGFTNPPIMEFLRQNQNLIVDTRHFTTQFRDNLIASIDNLDENIGGLMINADNFHALRFLQNKYKNSIKCTYIDPPYNSPSSEVLYKNSFKHSAWLSLMYNRIEESNLLSSEDGSIVIAIDKYEHNNLFSLCKMVFPERDIVSIAIEHNKKGTQGDHFSYSNEYAIYAISSKLNKLNEKVRDESDWEWSNFRNWGSESERSDAANCFYPIYVQNNEIVGYGDVLDDEIHPNMNEVLTGEFIIHVPNNDDVVIYANESNPLIAIYPVDDSGVERKWRYANQNIASIYDYLVIKETRSSNLQIQMPKYSDQFKTLWSDSKYNAGDYGTKLLSSLGFSKKDFEYPKSLYTVKDCIYPIANNKTIVLDYFAGSGTTGHAVLSLNRDDSNSSKKYILVEMGEYFSKVTQPRIKKVVYASEWKDGKPKSRETGVSHIMKYMRLESYEDALSNIELAKTNSGVISFGDEYLINYMLDIEAKGSLLNLKAFITPFDYTLKITEKNESRERPIDVCETFNYLVGLTVCQQNVVQYYKVRSAEKPAYEGAVDLVKDDTGIYAFRQIEGTLPDGRRALIIWRNINEDNILESNAALDAYFSKYRINPQDREYDVIFVNGDNNLENLRLDSEEWKVVMTEAEFNKRMWEETE
ncbi:MAG: site-specific DNA-methyltransferase [Muribaculaceae bacterium]|nr:site-specific DNA-methyltransferase [Muribaculaceae bacterium]